MTTSAYKMKAVGSLARFAAPGMDFFYGVSLKSHQNTIFVKVGATIGVMKCHIQEHGGEERVYFTYRSV